MGKWVCQLINNGPSFANWHVSRWWATTETTLKSHGQARKNNKDALHLGHFVL